MLRLVVWEPEQQLTKSPENQFIQLDLSLIPGSGCIFGRSVNRSVFATIKIKDEA